MAGQQSTFDTLLGKLSSLIGDDNSEATAYGVKNALFGFPGVAKATNALNPDPQVTNRASMLPIGNYEDGSMGLAWPQSAVDAYEAMGRFGRGENPQPQDAVLAGLAMTGGGFGSLAGRGVRAVSGRALESAVPIEQIGADAAHPGPVSLHHGTDRVFRRFDLSRSKDIGTHFGTLDQAQTRAKQMAESSDASGKPARTIPAILDAQNVVTLPDMRWSWPGDIAKHLERVDPEKMSGLSADVQPLLNDKAQAFQLIRDRLAKAGYDGIRYRNFGTEGDGWSYIATKPGTVRSATTGETLFSNPKEAAPAGLLATSGLDRQQPVYRGQGRALAPGETMNDVTFWTDSPERASDYAKTFKWSDSGPEWTPEGGVVYPGRMDTAGFKDVDWGAMVDNGVHSPMLDQMVREAKDAGFPGITLRNVVEDDGPRHTQYVPFERGRVISPLDGSTLFSNPKEAAPAGLLATSGLERIRAEDTAKPRSIPDAPMSLDDLQSYVDQNFENGSGNRVMAARAENPQRYWDYANGLHDVINPESDWISSGPTLQSGGATGGAVGTAGSSDHHSRSQPRGEGGRFVAKDSFDGRLAALDKMMVDLDGDGTPDVAMPANALMRVGQESAPNYLNRRGYQQQPPQVQKFEQDQAGADVYMKALMKRWSEYEAQGMSREDARAKAESDPDINALWKKSMGMP